MKKYITLKPGDELSVSIQVDTDNNSSCITPMLIKHRENEEFTVYCDFPVDLRPYAGSSFERPFYDTISDKQRIQVYLQDTGLCDYELPKLMERIFITNLWNKKVEKHVWGFDSKGRQVDARLVKQDIAPAFIG